MFGVFEINGPEEPAETFPSGAEAAQAAQLRNVAQAEAGSDTRFKVKPIVDDSWKERERRRLVYGEYTRLPPEVNVMAQACKPEHYAHASKSKPGYVAYTESPEKGMQDRQTRKRAGSYLREFWPDMADSEVQRLALICDNDAAPRELLTADSADDFERVYTEGPSSCMSYEVDYFESSEHPTRAYAGYDLAIGYIESEDRITGRAVLWPAEMLHSVIYGDIERMQKALTDAGYSEGTLEGARLSKIEDYNRCGVYVLPYIDDTYAVNDCGDWFEIAEYGDIRADGVNGLSEPSLECTNCGESLDPDDCNHVDGDPYCYDCSMWCEVCEECATEGTYIESSEQHVCEYCRDQHFTACESCHEYIEDCTIIDHTNGSHCEDCFMDEYTSCVECDDSIAHGDAHENEDGDPVCEDCAPEDSETEDFS